MNSEIKNVIASVKARLQNKAQALSKPFNEVLRYYGIERFLYRLSLTPYGRNFVLKGGLVFYAWGISHGRPTRDIDLSGVIHSSLANLIQIVTFACQQPVPNDGLIFLSESITAEEIQLEADYPGIRSTFLGMLGKAEIPMQIDIGFSDDITPDPVEFSYPTMLDMAAPNLLMYPPESVISEKFHAIVRLGEINSRMKDYYDIWLLSNRFDFSGLILKTAIAKTFNKRQMEIPTNVPLGLTPEFAEVHRREWMIFLRRFGQEDGELSDMDKVITRLRSFLMPPVEALTQGIDFDRIWKAGIGWE